MQNLNDSDFHHPRSLPNPQSQRTAKKHDRRRTFKFRVFRQRPIDYFIVDFYCPTLKLVIEIDGDSHYSEQGQDYDQERSQRLTGYGLKVIRFTNQQVLENFESICEVIGGLILPSPS